jgi:DNA-binding transcriptional LysR family regulator
MSSHGWIGVELRHFLALEAVANEGSFHGAAASLGYTQSAISQQIAALERAVGHKLVERPGGSRPVHLTRAGEIVLTHAQAIGTRLASAQSDLQAHFEGILDPLRVGAFGRGTGALLPGIFRRLEDTRGLYTQIHIREARTEDALLTMVRRGEVDLAFVEMPVDAEGCEHIALLADDYLLVVDPESAEAGAVSLTLEDLAALPLIGFKQGGDACQLTDYFRSFNLTPAWQVASDDIETIHAFVTAGFGAALLPRLATLSLGSDVRVLELDCGLPPRLLGLAWSAARGRTGAADDFVVAALAEAARYGRAKPRLAYG